MPRYRLHPHLSYALVDGEPIFLDIREDRYFGLDPDLSADLADLAQGAGSLDRAAAGRLLAAGLIRAGGDGRTGATDVRVPAASLELEEPAPRLSALQHAEGLALVGAAVACLRLGHLEAILRPLATPMPAADPMTIRAEARRFDVLRRRMPWQRRCLADSIALSWFLRRRSLPSTLVVGVTAAPFAAHCWVQDEEHVLNDSADVVASFTPILALPS